MSTREIELLEALEPFATLGEQMERLYDNSDVSIQALFDTYSKDFKRARAALSDGSASDRVTDAAEPSTGRLVTPESSPETSRS